MEQIGVLLVEDNPGDARLLREAVQEVEGIRIELTHHANLKDALARLNQERFDLIMLDLSLPDAEGLETLVRMHAQAPSIPIVVLTGLDDEALAVRAVREGAQDYLVKGQVSGQVLVRAMRYATERKRAVEALQRSEEYFRSLIENALDIITVVDENGLVRYGSPSLNRVLGYDPSELQGTNALLLVHPEDKRRLRETLRAGIANPTTTHSVEFRLRHRNGSWRVLEAIGKRFEASDFSGIVLNSRDITERKHAEETIRAADETLRAIIETSPLAIYSFDLNGNVKHWNAAAERIFGYSAAEVINRPLPTLLPEDIPLFHHRLQHPERAQPRAGYETKRLRKDGTSVEVSVWNTQLRDAAGAATGILALVADNTERKRLEDQFRQSQKMEAVGRLAGGVAHDFNNLLTVITGYCQMLLERLSPADPLTGDMQQVMKAAERATTLTKQLLAFSRQQIVQPKVVDLHGLVADMDHILKRLVGEDIDVSIQGRNGACRVRIDPGQLEQVIVNLVVNARDAMPGGGKVSLETSSVEILEDSESPHAALSPGPYVTLTVRDTGVGIPDEIRPHLFEPFFTTKERGRGTGLGLSTSYGIVKQNKGEILVSSEHGMGSAFQIYLPRVEEPVDVDNPPKMERTTPRGSETILVAEDEEGVRRVVVEMLQQQGYHVLAAPGGAEALALYNSLAESVHLLITDVVMPKMSGRELADRLRGRQPSLRVLFVSGYTDSDIVHHGVLEPGTHFLQKPFTPDLLARKVWEVLQK